MTANPSKICSFDAAHDNQKRLWKHGRQPWSLLGNTPPSSRRSLCNRLTPWFHNPRIPNVFVVDDPVRFRPGGCLFDIQSPGWLGAQRVLFPYNVGGAYDAGVPGHGARNGLVRTHIQQNSQVPIIIDLGSEKKKPFEKQHRVGANGNGRRCVRKVSSHVTRDPPAQHWKRTTRQRAKQTFDECLIVVRVFVAPRRRILSLPIAAFAGIVESIKRAGEELSAHFPILMARWSGRGPVLAHTNSNAASGRRAPCTEIRHSRGSTSSAASTAESTETASAYEHGNVCWPRRRPRCPARVSACRAPMRRSSPP